MAHAFDPKTTLLLCALSSVCACDPRSNPAPVAASATGVSERSSSVFARDTSVTKVETALTLKRSAYGVKLVVHQAGWTLITAEGFYHKEGETSVNHRATTISPPLAVMGEDIVHWADGRLVATSLSGVGPRLLGTLGQMPRDVFASNEHFAWLERGKLGDRVLTIDRHQAVNRVVYNTEHNIVSGAMLQDWVYFVESLPAGRWRLVAASIRNDGTAAKPRQGVTLGVIQNGRPPAFLLAETDLYYYDGPTRSVRRVSPDLQQETIVANGVICSPLAVAAQVYCAHVGGVFSVSPPNDLEAISPTHVLDSEARGPITAIAANARQVVWVEDLDGKHLRVRSVRLP